MIKHLLFVTVSFTISVQSIFAQCGGEVHDSSSNSSYESEDGNSGSRSSKGRPVFVDPVPINFGISTSSAIQTFASSPLVKRETADTWFDNNLAYGGFVSWSPQRLKDWEFGISLSGQRLHYFNQTVFVHPDLPFESDDLRPLNVNFYRKANVFTNTIQADYTFFRFKGGISMFGRSEFGFRRYKTTAGISYRDTCDCFQDVDRKRTKFHGLSAGLGVGLKWEYRFFGVKALLNYSVYGTVDFIDEKQFSTWTWEFDKDKYSFDGIPDKGLFRINQPNNENMKTKIGQVNLQFIFYINLNSGSEEDDRWM